MSNKKTQISYLFLLSNPSPSVRKNAAAQLREQGCIVIASYGISAIEALATPEQAVAALGTGMFKTGFKGRMKADHFDKMDNEQKRIVEQWNVRFDSSYLEKTRARKMVGVSWGDKSVKEPLPYTRITVQGFMDILKKTGRKTTGKKNLRKTIPLKGIKFTDFEGKIALKYKDPVLAYHLARLANRLPLEYQADIENLTDKQLKEIRDRFFKPLQPAFGRGKGGRSPEAPCWKMTGEMSVGIVFVESSQAGGPKFGNTERNQIHQEIVDGLNWLASIHPAGNLAWVYDVQNTRINVANGTGTSTDDYWRDPAMAQVVYNGASYSGSVVGMDDYREDMRTYNSSDHALVILVTPYATNWFAYSTSDHYVVMAKVDDWGGWGQGKLDCIAAHEVCHQFGAGDEYTGAGTPCSSCETQHGCDQIPNGNCGSCASPQQKCVMDANLRKMCNYTKGHIGWSDLFVELWTADDAWAGTDDHIWVDIGDRKFTLDTPDHNDRERGNREGYAIWAGGIDRSEIKRILIGKNADGSFGGWKLARVRVWHQGDCILDQSPNRWLEDGNLTWVGYIGGTMDFTLVNTLEVRVMTGDVRYAGTDDDVTLRLAGRSWDLDNPDHNDFERGNNDTFHLDPGTGFYLSDIHSIVIEKSSDGCAGGWRLRGLEIIVNGITIYYNNTINTWIEDDSLIWTGSI